MFVYWHSSSVCAGISLFRTPLSVLLHMSAADHRGPSAGASVKRRREASPPSASSFAVELSALPPPPAYFDPKQNGRNRWQLYRYQNSHLTSYFFKILNLTHAHRKKWTWGRWERLMNRTVYVVSLPPHGNLAQGRWGQPPLTLFSYAELRCGRPDVPFVDVESDSV
jgi:hypothetical protein